MNLLLHCCTLSVDIGTLLRSNRFEWDAVKSRTTSRPRKELCDASVEIQLLRLFTKFLSLGTIVCVLLYVIKVSLQTRHNEEATNTLAAHIGLLESKIAFFNELTKKFVLMFPDNEHIY